MQLFPFQAEGVKQILAILAEQDAAVLADDMGLGKTIQALRVTEKARDVLILCPASVKGVWESEIEQWCKGDEFQLFQTLNTSKDVLSYNRLRPLHVICSYDLAIRKPILSQIVKQQWDYIIYDEAHNALGNKETLRCRVALGNLPECSTKRLFLTGSVTSNKIINLWPLFRHCCPEKIGKYWSFAYKFTHVEDNGYGKRSKGGKNLDKLEKIAKTFMVRRKKEEVLPELPEKLEQKVYIECDTLVQEAQARAIRDFSETQLESDDPPPYISTALRELGFAKVTDVSDYLYNLWQSEQEPIVVFCNHKAVFVHLIENLSNESFSVGGIAGDTPSKERKEVVAEFQAGKLDFFIGTSAASEGITLHHSSIVVYAEMFWRLSTMEQSMDRLHRIGQKSVVQVKFLICRGTFDEVLYRGYKNKKRLKEKVVG